MKLPRGITTEIAKAMWERSHDGRWTDLGDGQDESRDIYFKDAEVAVRVFRAALRAAQR